MNSPFGNPQGFGHVPDPFGQPGQGYPPQQPWGAPLAAPGAGPQFGGQGFGGQGFGPPPPSSGSGLAWKIALGCGAILLVCFVACCGFAAWFNTAPTVSPSARQPFSLAGIPVPAFPDRASAAPDDIGDGDTLTVYTLGETDGYYNPPGHGGELHLYLPRGEHAAGSLPCVLIAGAGSSMLQGMKLSAGDVDEHVPYVEAGIAVIAYELDGPEGAGDNQQQYTAFRAACAGVVNGRNAFEFARTRVPEVNPNRIFAVGHSSAATAALLLAEHEPRLAGCVAYNGVAEVDKRFPPALVRMMSGAMPGLADFLVQSSPRTHEAQLACPVLFFHSKADEVTPVAPIRAMAERLRAANQDVTLELVPTGDHYRSMIEEGIPRGIAWIKARAAR